MQIVRAVCHARCSGLRWQFAVLLTGWALFVAGRHRTTGAQRHLVCGAAGGAMGFGRGDAGRIGMLMALMLQSAALATAANAALVGFTEWHWLFKTTGDDFALVLGSCHAYSTSVRGLLDSKPASAWLPRWLDRWRGCVLMFQGFFIPWPGEFSGGAPVLCRAVQTRAGVVSPPGALAATLGIGVGMYAFCGRETCPLLRVPVAAIVLVIADGRLQAMGRATVLRSGPALRVALGRVLCC